MKSVGDFFRKLKPLVEGEIAESKVLFGAKHLGENDPQPPRVVVCDHNEAGDQSSFGPATSVHRAPRPVGTERCIVMIECWAYDSASTEERDRQSDALQELRHCVWRHTQALVRAELHSAPGIVPGIYETKNKALITPRERIVGAKCRFTFSIDFAVRDIAPTELNTPTGEITMVIP